MSIAEICLVIAFAEVANLDIADRWLSEMSETESNARKVSTINVRRHKMQSNDSAMTIALWEHDSKAMWFHAGKAAV